MTDFGARLRNTLEPVLALADPHEKISAYHDMPYAIFHYDPEYGATIWVRTARQSG